MQIKVNPFHGKGMVKPRGKRHEPLLNVVHEDHELLVVNKPGGLVCHPTKGDDRSSLVGRLRLRLGDGPWHLLNRLDRETSGACLCAKNDAAAKAIRGQFEGRTVRKGYRAIVHGWPDATGVIAAPIGRDNASEVGIRRCVREDGDEALTEFELLERFEREGERMALLDVRPRTGRTHQIRIHLAHIGYPIVGDKLYGLDPSAYLAFVRGTLTDEQRRLLRLPCHALHARSLTIDWNGKSREFLAEVSHTMARMGDRLAAFGEFVDPPGYPRIPPSSE